jgi:RNA recognition motif-containing protein
MTESPSQHYNPFTYEFSFSHIALNFLNDKLQYDPTEVLLFKKVPFNATELDVIELCKPYGQIEDVCLIKTKGYAFVQFQNTKMAQFCYETLKIKEAELKDSKVYVFHTGKHEITKPEGSNSYPSRSILVAMSSLVEEINPVVIENLVTRYGNPLKVMRLQDVPYNAIFEMKDIEEAIRLKEGLNNFEITKTARINASFVSGKFFTMKSSPKTPKMKFSDRNCTSLENSTVSSPIFNSGDNSLETFSDGISESFFSISRQNSDEVGSKTVMVRNLPENTTCDDLFKLFGMYGNISKVKIFYKAPDSALVQFQESYQANLAKKFLNNCPIKNSSLNVSLSKSEISTTISENNDFFKDYVNQKGQRYRKQGSKNFRNIAQPSKVLHLSNMQAERDPTFYLDIFNSCGTVVKHMILAGDSQNLLVEMKSLEEAVEALVKFHNCEIEGKYLKVSFSKYDNIKFL